MTNFCTVWHSNFHAVNQLSWKVALSCHRKASCGLCLLSSHTGEHSTKGAFPAVLWARNANVVCADSPADCSVPHPVGAGIQKVLPDILPMKPFSFQFAILMGLFFSTFCKRTSYTGDFVHIYNAFIKKEKKEKLKVVIVCVCVCFLSGMHKTHLCLCKLLWSD